jgi:DNA-binding transcriptional ArsR family regulator/uncharacterized protein YndB with AHSA1/START domain
MVTYHVVMDEPVEVFRALADPTRRTILDALFAADGQSVGALCALSPEMTRFGVMKHLRVLEDANLVTTAKSGRSRLYYLNPVPIAQIAHRWVSKYAAPFATALVDLNNHVASLREPTSSEGSPMNRPEHVYQIYVAASPELVWTAITDSEWTRRYFHRTAFVEPPVAGRPYRKVLPDGRPASDGMIEEMTPPIDGQPGRFVHTWHVLYDEAMSAEPAGRVEWLVETAGEGLTRVQLVHSGLEQSPLTWENVKDGWVWVLDALKTVIETGRSLPVAS